jgi:hypothetical protein
VVFNWLGQRCAENLGIKFSPCIFNGILCFDMPGRDQSPQGFARGAPRLNGNGCEHRCVCTPRSGKHVLNNENDVHDPIGPRSMVTSPGNGKVLTDRVAL